MVKLAGNDHDLMWRIKLNVQLGRALGCRGLSQGSAYLDDEFWRLTEGHWLFQIAGLLGVLLKPKFLSAVRLFLWLLSTRIGTVLLGGRASMSSHFPYFHTFSCLPRGQQERVLRQWSLSALSSLRGVYKLFKMITMWAVYTKVCTISVLLKGDEYLHNILELVACVCLPSQLESFLVNSG